MYSLHYMHQTSCTQCQGLTAVLATIAAHQDYPMKAEPPGQPHRRAHFFCCALRMSTLISSRFFFARRCVPSCTQDTSHSEHNNSTLSFHPLPGEPTPPCSFLQQSSLLGDSLAATKQRITCYSLPFALLLGLKQLLARCKSSTTIEYYSSRTTDRQAPRLAAHYQSVCTS